MTARTAMSEGKMHFLIAIGLVACMIAYVAGETAARVFVGFMLGLGAVVCCVIFGISVYVVGFQ